jgi:hypothetical protein
MAGFYTVALHTTRTLGATATRDGWLAPYVTGYMVGGFVKPTSLPYGPLKVEDIAAALRAFVREHRATYAADGRLLVGTWVDNGTLHIDASKHYTDKQSAIAAGIANGEVAIWDCAAGAAVSLAPYRAALQGVAG